MFFFFPFFFLFFFLFSFFLFSLFIQLQVIISAFGDQVAPHAESIVASLSQAFQRYAMATDDDESAFAAMNCLDSISALLSALSGEEEEDEDEEEDEGTCSKLKNENVVDCVTILDCNYRYSDFYELDFLLLIGRFIFVHSYFKHSPNQSVY